MSNTVSKSRRARGQARQETLLDAADQLLLEREASQISLQDVSQAADTPLASVYHYFANAPALFESLANRHLKRIETIYDQELSPAQTGTWQDMLRGFSDLARAYYNGNPAVMRLFLGPDVGWRIRQSDLETNIRFGRRQYSLLQRAFHIPEDRLLPEKLAMSLSIADAVWSVSYIRFGNVTDAMAEEAFRARFAYLGLYIPHYAFRRL